VNVPRGMAAAADRDAASDRGVESLP